MFDLIIERGKLVDGTGAHARHADVAVKGGYISEIGDLSHETATERIDASGLVVAPGFIDSHCHSDLALFSDPTAECKVCQGVTTEIVGNCGWSVFPMVKAQEILSKSIRSQFLVTLRLTGAGRTSTDIGTHWVNMELA